jgi:hypothetical protein
MTRKRQLWILATIDALVAALAIVLIVLGIGLVWVLCLIGVLLSIQGLYALKLSRVGGDEKPRRPFLDYVVYPAVFIYAVIDLFHNLGEWLT